MKKVRKLAISAIGVMTILIVILISSANVITDWFWFNEVGYRQLFTAPLIAKLLLGLGAAICSFLVLSLIFKLARKFSPSSKSFNLRMNTPQGPKVKLIDAGPVIRKITLPIVVLVSIIVGFTAAANWEVILLYINKTPFNSVDPLFQRDISYYIFTLPFIDLIIKLLETIVIIGFIGSILIYLLLGVIQLRGGLVNLFKTTGPGIIHSAKRMLSILLASVFIIISAKTYFVDIPSLVYSKTGSFIGASYTDVHIALPVLQVSAAVALVVGLILLINAFKNSTRFVVASITMYLLVGIIGGWVLPEIVQRLIVLPNEFAKETPYIQNNISATQKAYGIDQIEKRDLTGETLLTNQDIENNQLTIQNIRLWDRGPLLDTFSQLQEIRTYYEFLSVDNDRYTIGGNLRQVLLSARELNTANLPQLNFINEHLTFTHGYGLTLSPVNEVTKEGLPVLFVKDLPPESSLAEIKINNPEIYYGEMPNNYVIVNSSAKEFNYPSGENNIYSTYSGNGGIQISSWMDKLLFALKFKSSKLFLSNDITSNSRLLMYRDIDDRVRKLETFLKFDLDPYLVITESGAMEWIYDAYTVSDRYPYAEKVSDSRLNDFASETSFIASNLNYIRNSVKITINAYTGETNIYVSDANDPIIQTYQKVFKGVFKSMDEMPADLRTHVRYPEDLFAFQTNIYSVYHMEEPQNFYNKEDEWQIPTQPQNEESDPMMRHMIMKLPGENKEEYILMLPFTPKDKDNLAAWMVARNDNENYGKIVVYRFPKQKLVYGPNQIINRINQDPEISRQISLWDQRGSEVISGNLLVIPIEESLIYVQPIYLRAEGGKIPELKRVIVAHENRISMEETLEQALNKIFADTEQTIDQENETNNEAPVVVPNNQLLNQASELYNAAIDAQKAGDWTTYGSKIDELGGVINKLLEEE
ncbi:MAG: UPF0182 family protein [Patescibacteria group bacterium]|jgi:hypothetical protein